MEKVYKIYVMHESGRDFAGEHVYVGKTTKSLKTRFGQHRCDVKTRCRLKVHKYMRKVGPENFEIRLLEMVRGNYESCLSENWWKNFLEAGLNKVVPGNFILFNGRKEYSANYYRENRERLREKQVSYYWKNREVIRERKRKYDAIRYRVNKEEI